MREGGGWMREREKQVRVAKEPCVPKKEVCDQSDQSVRQAGNA